MSTAASPLPERASFSYLVGETVERLVRIQRSLSNEDAFAPREYDNVIELFRALTDTSKQTLSDNSRLINKVLFAPNALEHEKIALLTILSAQIKLLYGIHERLVFLPRRGVEPEIFSTLQDLFRTEWNDASVILTTIHNAYEYRLLDVLSNIEIFEEKLPELSKMLSFDPETSILELPFVDRDNPLSWPFLAHEFGHSIDRRKGISDAILEHAKQAVQIRPESLPVVTSWVAEVFADFVAGRVLGPAALLPLFSLELGLSPILAASRISSTHPPTSFRLVILRNFLATDNVSFAPFEGLFNLYNADQDLKFDRLGEKAKSSREMEEKLLKYIFNQIEKDLIMQTENLEIFKFGPECQKAAVRLKENLKGNIPISSHRHSTDEEIRSHLNELKKKTDVKASDVYSALALLNERPAAPAEVLSAGWLYKLETYTQQLATVFDASPPDFEKYSQYLSDLDGLLLKSLQLSSVHAHLHGHLNSKDEKS